MISLKLLAPLAVLTFAASHPVMAGEKDEISSRSDLKMPLTTFDYVSNCMNFWGSVLGEWERNGGGLQSSLRATREQIAHDRHSRFARFVRDTWAAQSKHQSLAGRRLGFWPVETDTFREVMLKFAQTSKEVPEDCRLPDWFAEKLRLHLVNTNASEDSLPRLLEVPDSMPWTAERASSINNWIGFWLLVRTN